MQDNNTAPETNNTAPTPSLQMAAPQRHTVSFNLDFSEILHIMARRWYWFVISLAITMSLGVGYLMRSQYTYHSDSRIMVAAGDAASRPTVDLSAIGVGVPNTSVLNEMYLLESPVLMEEVVRRLGLNNRYFTRDGLRFTDLYGETPITVTPADTLSMTHFAFNVKLDGNEGFTLHSFSGHDDENIAIKGKLGQTVNTPFGPFSITKSPWYSGNKYREADITFSHVPTADMAQGFFQVNAYPDYEKASVITLTIFDISAKRAHDVNEMLLQVYRDQTVVAQTKAAKATSEFINNRLEILKDNLGQVEGSISSYKAHNRLPDVSMASSTYFGQSVSNQSAMLDINASIAMAQYVRRELLSEGLEATLPVNTGLEGAGIQGQIAEYNRMVFERNRLLQSGSESNSVIADLTSTLSILKNNIIRSLDNYIASLNNQLATVSHKENRSTSELAVNPSREKYLLSVEREQKVYEQLYMFLLQKREESELSQAYIKENMMMLAEPTMPSEPDSPQKWNILLVALAIGLLAPVLIIFLRESLNTTVRTRRDLGMLGMPFVGEVPYGPGRPKRIAFMRRIRSASAKDVVVKEGSNNVINEAFRAVRTSLEFMTPDLKEGARIISFTSGCSGSGKTFIVMNLAKTLALSNKRVLVVDLDMRKASLSKWGERTDNGISNYLIGQSELTDIIRTDVDGNENVDILPVGILPPNPVELLSHKRLKEMFAQLRDQYDYILIDCPPAEIVADARIISQYADMTIFVIRAGMFEKSMLGDIVEYAETGRYHNLAIMLNGTDPNSIYRRKRYGYGYGYGYVKR